MASSTRDELSQKTQEVIAPLVHMKKLFRIRNWLRSPLLRLPTEIIVHVLSFIMIGLDSSPPHLRAWMPVLCNCHQIHSDRSVVEGGLRV
jgi:hypothetical protein